MIAALDNVHDAMAGAALILLAIVVSARARSTSST